MIVNKLLSLSLSPLSLSVARSWSVPRNDTHGQRMYMYICMYIYMCMHMYEHQLNSLSADLATYACVAGSWRRGVVPSVHMVECRLRLLYENTFYLRRGVVPSEHGFLLLL